MGTKSEPFRFVATGTVDLARVWADIRGGRFEVVDAASSGENHYLSLRRCSPKRTYSEPLIEELELALMQGTKTVAIAKGVAISTLVVRRAVTLGELGVPTKLSRLPLVLGLAVAAHQKDLRLSVDVQRQVHGLAVRYSIDPSLKNLLSPSEFAIAMALLAGGAHAEIARERGVSLRTVANQAAAVFRRLGVSGRMDLIRWLAAQGAAPPTITTKDLPKGSRVGEIGVLRAEIDALRRRVAKLEGELACAKEADE